VNVDSKAVFTNMKKQSEEVEKLLTSTTLKRLNDLVKIFNSLQERIKEREESRKNFDYYVHKVKGLRESHEKLLKQGKQEPPKDTERRVQNEKKLEEATAQYTNVNNLLTTDLSHLWDSRFDVVGPVLVEAMAGEVNFANTLQQVMAGLNVPAVSPMPYELKSKMGDEKSSSEPQNEIQTVSQFIGGSPGTTASTSSISSPSTSSPNAYSNANADANANGNSPSPSDTDPKASASADSAFV